MDFLHSLFFHEDDTPKWKMIAAAIATALGIIILGVGIASTVRENDEPTLENTIVLSGTVSPTMTPTIDDHVSSTMEASTHEVVGMGTIDTLHLTAVSATEAAAMVSPTEPPADTPSLVDDDADIDDTLVSPTSSATPTETPTIPSPTTDDSMPPPMAEEIDEATSVPAPTDSPRPIETTTQQRQTIAEEEIIRSQTASPTATNPAIPQNTATPTATPTTTPTYPPDHVPSPVPTRIPDPPDITLFGIEVTQAGTRSHRAALSELAQTGATSWVRFNGVVWPQIEKTEGHYDWSTVDDSLRTLGASGLAPIVIIRGTPTWAQQDWGGAPPPGAACSPIRRDKLDAFGRFLRALVSRYSQPPYNIHHWELGNEPDVSPALVGGETPYGCWGDPDDPFYGGGYYAEMLKHAYPAIKAADPQATVVLGGLLLDCDYQHPPDGKSCESSQFFEGILRNGGGDVFDIVAYHGYSYFSFWLPGTNDWDMQPSSWSHRGGMMLGRLRFLQEVLNRHSVQKPILVNEIGLLCWLDPADPQRSSNACMANGFLDAQANYLIRSYTRVAATDDLLAAAWYTLDDPNWNEAGLFKKQEPRPAYQTLIFFSGLLKDATHIRATPPDQTLEQHTFEDASRRYDIAWTNDGSQHEIALPPTTRTVYDMFGNEQPFGGERTTVGFEPIIIVSDR